MLRFVNPTPTPTHTPKPDQVLSVREQLALCPSPRRGPTTAGSMAGSPVVDGGKMGGGKAAAAPAAPAAPALARHSSSELEEMAAFEPLTSNPSPKLLAPTPTPTPTPNSYPQLLPPTPTPNS